MSQLVRKAAVAMAATAVVSAPTGIGSVPAYADDSSIQTELCTGKYGNMNRVTVKGTNQNNQQVSWKTERVFKGTAPARIWLVRFRDG
jgi:hypothetical protein